MAHIAVLLVVLIFTGWSSASAQAAYDDPRTPEGWAWAKIRNDEIADFTARCGPPEFDLDPDAKPDWADPCRQISSQFLAYILTEAKSRDQVPQHGVRLEGANIAGGIDLADAEIKAQVSIETSRIDGDATLDDSRWKRPLSLRGSTVTGSFSAERIHADSAMMLNNALFEGDVDLTGAIVGDDLAMWRSSFDQKVSLRNGKVGGDLEMWGSSFRDAVDLTNARIDRSVAMDEASFAETVYAGGLNVGRDLFMRRGAEFRGEIFLIGARVGALLELRYAKAWFVDLSWAEVTGLHTDGLRWWCEDGKPLNGIADHSLTLGKLGSQVPRCERSDGADLPKFILRNVHVGAFQDDPDAWPPSLDLEGFSYDRLGGIAGVSKLANSGRADMRKRSPDEWTDWLARDRIFSTQPYSQLSSVLAAAGHRDGAEAIQFVGRQRERGEARARGDLGSWAWLTLFSLVAGYGIGLYTFRVLWWVIGLIVLGAVCLSYSPYARRQGLLWRLGASLHRLLPVVELSKEFKDFFDNPQPSNAEEPRNLNRWQTAYFAGHAIAGWVLGLFLLAAMSGLTQKG